MSEHHKHQHVMGAVGSGNTLKGTIAHNPGDHGTPGSVRVTIQAAGAHQS